MIPYVMSVFKYHKIMDFFLNTTFNLYHEPVLAVPTTSGLAGTTIGGVSTRSTRGLLKHSSWTRY